MGGDRPAAVKRTRARTKPPRYDNQDTALPGAYMPVRIAANQADQTPGEERVPLFYIGEVEYTVPAEVPVSVSLRALTMARTMSNTQLALWLVEQSVGTETLLILADSGATREQVRSIFGELGRRYLGQMEAMTGNP